MPNIEIHGFPDVQTNEVQALVNKIWGLLGSADYVNEIVVERVPSIVTDRVGNSQPYLRIHATAGVDDIVQRLDELDMDVELPASLTKFIPRRSLRN